MDYKKIALNNATLHIFKTTKFKKISIDVLLTDVVTEKNLSYRTLLSRCLESKSKSYDNKQKINRKLDMLYGANFGFSIGKTGDSCYIDASIDGVNPKYVGDSNLLNDFFVFLSEFIFNPVLDESNVKEEKRLLLDDYKFEYENKSVYALIRSNEITYKNEKAKFKYNGDENIVRTLTSNDLIEYFDHIKKTNKVDIIVSGDVNEKEVLELAKKYFDFGFKRNVEPLDYESKEIKKVETVKETTKSKQSQLVLRYRTNIRYKDDLDMALVLANTIFGGFSSSLLFTNVREKNSLCYSISSTIARFKGALTVTAGINKENYDKAVELINKQLDDMKNGNFSDQLFEMARLSLISTAKKQTDSLGSITKKIYTYELLDKEFSLYDPLYDIERLTKEEVIEAIKNVKLDTIYFLEGSDNVEEI